MRASQYTSPLRQLISLPSLETGTERPFLSCSLAWAGTDGASLSHLEPQFPFLFMVIKTFPIFLCCFKD